MEKLFKQYLNALNNGNLEGVLSLFEVDAIVDSPLYGKMSAAKFYEDLFADTNQSETTLLNIFTSDNGNSVGALHFHYSWLLKSGKTVNFECVDVIEINTETKKIKTLKIIYDTAPIRTDFKENRG